jgi:hypothetical protein
METEPAFSPEIFVFIYRTKRLKAENLYANLILLRHNFYTRESSTQDIWSITSIFGHWFFGYVRIFY